MSTEQSLVKDVTALDPRPSTGGDMTTAVITENRLEALDKLSPDKLADIAKAFQASKMSTEKSSTEDVTDQSLGLVGNSKDRLEALNKLSADQMLDLAKASPAKSIEAINKLTSDYLAKIAKTSQASGGQHVDNGPTSASHGATSKSATPNLPGH